MLIESLLLFVRDDARIESIRSKYVNREPIAFVCGNARAESIRSKEIQ
jgi:hypothetical protein